MNNIESAVANYGNVVPGPDGGEPGKVRRTIRKIVEHYDKSDARLRKEIKILKLFSILVAAFGMGSAVFAILETLEITDLVDWL